MSISPFITIIVPVYNVEKYIEKCIQSLLNQTYKSFEVIIVSDGSLDRSIAIAKHLVGDDSRFIFLEKENGGQASARNMGLTFAKGDYIGFLDADDYLSSDALQYCAEILESDVNIDILLFGLAFVNDKGAVLDEFLPNVDRYYMTDDILLAYSSINYSVCNKIFKKHVFENSRFAENITHEDKEILPRLLYGQNLKLLEKILYFYVQSSGSTMRSYNTKSSDSYIYIYREYEKLLRENEIYDQYKIYYEKAYLKFCFFVELTHIFNYSPNFMEDYKKLVSKIGAEKLTLLNVKRLFTIKSKFFIFACLLKLSPRLAKLLYKLTSQK